MFSKVIRFLRDKDIAQPTTGDLPSPDVCSLAMLKKPDNQVPQDWKNIQAYPPAPKAIPAEPIDGVLYRNRDRIFDISEALGLSDEAFETLLMPVIRNFAAFVHLLPASEAHHHRGQGGALKHALEVAFWSARAAEDIIFCRNSDPVERRKIEPMWRVATCVAGLLHDAGKPIADLVVTDEEGEVWHPLQMPLYEFLRAGKRRNFFITWRAGRYKRHESFTQRAADKIIPADFVTEMMKVDPNIIFGINDAFYCIDDSNHIAKIVNWADQESTRRDALADVERTHGGDFDFGIPVHRHMFAAIRRLVSSGKWEVNKPGSKIWHSNEGTFLVFKNSLSEVIQQVKQEVGFAIRNDPDGLTDELIQRGLAVPRYIPGGEPKSEDDLGEYYLYWLITPKALVRGSINEAPKLSCIKVDTPERVFNGELPAAAEIKLWTAEELKEGGASSFSMKVQTKAPEESVSTVVEGAVINRETGEILSEIPKNPGGSQENAEVAQDLAAPSDAGTTPDAEQIADFDFDMPFGGNSQSEGKDPVATEAPSESSTDPLFAKRTKPSKGQTQGAGSSNDASRKAGGNGAEDTCATEKEQPNDVRSLLAVIDEEMEMPFGMGTLAAEESTPSSSDRAESPLPIVSVENQEHGEQAGPESEDPPSETKEIAAGEVNRPSADIRKAEPAIEVKKRKVALPGEAVGDAAIAKGMEGESPAGDVAAEGDSSGGHTSPVVKMGKYQKVNTSQPQSQVIPPPQDPDPQKAYQQLLTDNASTGAGGVIEFLVKRVVEEGEVLGRNWFVEKGRVAIVWPGAFKNTRFEANKALDALERSSLIYFDPRRPMAKVTEASDVPVVLLDKKASQVIVAYLREKEKEIDPFYVPPHPDIQVSRRKKKPIDGGLSSKKKRAKAHQERVSNSEAIKSDSKSGVKIHTNSGNATKANGQDKPQRNKAEPISSPQSRTAKQQVNVEGPADSSGMGKAEKAMRELVRQMLAGEGAYVADLVNTELAIEVPTTVLDKVIGDYPGLSKNRAKKAFHVPAKELGFRWNVQGGTLTLLKGEEGSNQETETA